MQSVSSSPRVTSGFVEEAPVGASLGAEKVSEAALTILSVNDVSGEVPNGGFGQCLVNSSGDLALHVVPSLKCIGANTAGDIAGRALALFDSEPMGAVG